MTNRAKWLAIIAMLCASPCAQAADVSSSTFSETDASQGIFLEGMAPSAVNDNARAMMGAVKRWYNRINPTVVSAGTANAQTLTYTVAPTAYTLGDTYAFQVGSGLTNTGATTLNINGLGAKAVQTGGHALTGAELTALGFVSVVYDGTAFQIMHASGVADTPRSIFKLGTLNSGVQGLMDFYDLGLNPASTSTGVALRFFGRQQTDLTQIEGGVINCGLRVTTQNATKGDCDLVAYNWNGSSYSEGAHVALDGLLGAWVPNVDATYDNGISGQAWRDTAFTRRLYIGASAGTSGQVPISGGSSGSVAWGNPAVTSAIVNGTFDLSSASGTNAVLSFGFTPSSCEGHAAINNGSLSTYVTYHGHSDAAAVQSSLYGQAASQTGISNTRFFEFVDSTGSNLQQMVISYQTNQATLTNTKVGSPTGTVSYSVKCFK